MADHADQTLPRLPFLFPQRPADVRQHQQIVRQPAQPERRPAHFPAAGAAAERRNINHARRVAEPIGELQFFGGAPEHVFGTAAHQPLAGAVDDAQALLRIEGEHRDVDLFHDVAEQPRGLDRAQALFVKRFGQRVDLEQRGAERIVGVGGAAADRKVVFAQRRQQVGQRLQRHHDARADRRRQAKQRRQDDHRERPLHLRRVIVGPEDP